MIRFWLVISFLFSILSGFGQITQTIRGRVIDTDSRQPLIGANVIIVDSDPFIGASSDIDGYFTLESIAIGRVTLKVSFLGYSDITLNSIELNSSRETVLEIELQESAIIGEEVVITGTRDKTETINQMATVSARTFSVEESQRYAGSLNDVSRMAQNFAGVGIVNDQRNDLIIRGNSSFGVLYRLEGIDIPNPNHFSFQGSTGGPISILNNNVLSNSDFFTGAFPAEYGNAYGGAFDLHLRRGNDQKHQFLGQIGFNGAELMAEGPISRKSRASYLVNYRYSTLELFKVMGINFGTVAVPEYQDGNFHINLPDKHGKWDIFGIGGKSNIAFLDDEKNPDDTFFDDQGEDLYYGTSMAALGVSRTQLIGTKSYVKLTLSWSYNGRSIVNDTLNDINSEAYNVYTNNSIEGKVSLMAFYNRKISARHALKFGSFNDLLYFNMDEKYWIDTDNAYFVRSDFRGSTGLIQPFVQHQYRPGDKWTINAGLHSLIFLLNDSYTIEPRLGVKWKAAPRLTLGTGYGRHAQLPPLLLYFRKSTQPSGASKILNQDLEPILSDHFVVSADYLISENTHVKVEAYYQSLSNVPIDSAGTTYSILNQGANFDFSYPVRLVNEGRGQNYGLELTLEHFLHKGFYYLFTASIFESKYTAQNGNTYNTAFNGNQAYSLLFGKEWLLSSAENKKKKLTLTTDGRIAYAGGLRYTPLNTSATANGVAVYDYNRHFELKYPDYFRPDVRIALKLNGKKTTQEWAVDLQNIINRKNIFSREYSPATNMLEDRYQLGFLPVVLYRIYF
ncbi:MAG TPA: TonB-dependent receptor [Flavobacteriales bacterium]|nr:TonB-dependent receptor [Flavobacteriales bacterium]